MPQKTDTSGPAGAPSIISTDVTIRGDLESRGELQLDGRVEGDISCDTLVLGEKGQVTGNVSAESVTLRGKVKGNIEARVVRLEKTAKLTGDVHHETLSVEAGAVIDGQVTYTAQDSAKKILTSESAKNTPDHGQNAAARTPPQAAE